MNLNSTLFTEGSTIEFNGPEGIVTAVVIKVTTPQIRVKSDADGSVLIFWRGNRQLLRDPNTKFRFIDEAEYDELRPLELREGNVLTLTGKNVDGLTVYAEGAIYSMTPTELTLTVYRERVRFMRSTGLERGPGEYKWQIVGLPAGE